MSAGEEAQAWQQTVEAIAKKHEGVNYEPVGGLNPRGGPAALCPGGTNRITGHLEPDFWGASCDAEEREEGGLFKGKAVLPKAVLIKAHMPDLTKVVPAFNVESLERTAEDLLERNISRNKVQFESIDFNKRFLATVPSQYDPIALRELFSPGFLDWTAGIDRDVDFGASDKQMYFLWRLRERSQDEYELALRSGGELFKRVRNEMEEDGLHTYPPGPWHAGLEPFPDAPSAPNPG
jgi:hypothetical protein